MSVFKINADQTETELVNLERTILSGFYSSANGAYAGENNGWYRCNIPVTDFKQFILSNPTKAVTFRIIYMVGETFHSAISGTSDFVYTIPEGVTRILINFATISSNPATQSFTNFENLAEIEAISFKKYAIVQVETSLLERITALEEGLITNKVLKILSIGNSFAEDMQAYILDFAKSAGVNIIVANTYLSGASLGTHFNNSQNNAAVYNYQKHTVADGLVATPNKTLSECIRDEEWDIITFQQSSPFAGVYSSFQPFLNNLMGYVRSQSTNPLVKFGLIQPWAYSTTHQNAQYTQYYNADQITMFNAIVEAYKQAMKETRVDILIPCGTAIQNARTNPELLAIGDELTRDGYHLNTGLGRVIAGLTFFETLLAPFYKKDLFLDANRSWSSSETYFLAYLGKMAARNAKLNPFKVTEL